MENKEFYINDDGIRIHAKLDFPKEQKQKYPLIIIIHGFTGHMEERHITAVSKAMNEIGYVSLRAEMYGHGASDGQFCNHTLYKWISNAITVIDFAKYIRVAQMIDVEKAIDLYKGSVLLIHGDQDTTIPVSHAYRAAERYHNAKLVIIPGDTLCYDYHLLHSLFTNNIKLPNIGIVLRLYLYDKFSLLHEL